MNYPIVRIELQGMHMALQTMLTEHIAARDADIKNALERAVKTFDIGREVERQATDVLRKTVADLISSAVHKALWDDSEFRRKVTAQVADAIAQRIKE